MSVTSDEIAVVPVDAAVASVRIGHWHNGDDDLGPNLLDEGRIFGSETVGKLHEHLRWPKLGTVETAGEGVDGLGVRDDLLGLFVG